MRKNSLEDNREKNLLEIVQEIYINHIERNEKEEHISYVTMHDIRMKKGIDEIYDDFTIMIERKR